GHKVSWVYDHLSFHVAPEWGARVVPWVFPVEVMAVLLVVWRFWRSGMTDGVRFAGAAVLAFIVTGKVLSAPFLIWMLPFVTAERGQLGRRARRVFLLCCIPTTPVPGRSSAFGPRIFECGCPLAELSKPDAPRVAPSPAPWSG